MSPWPGAHESSTVLKQVQKKTNLYVDFKAADIFNTDQSIKVIDHLQHKKLLCWALEITDQVTFLQFFQMGGKYGHHSFFVAETQIENFY